MDTQTEGHVIFEDSAGLQTSDSGDADCCIDASIYWLVQCSTNPSHFNTSTNRLAEECENGTRHFAANGRSVAFADVAKMALEIRRYDLEKDEM